MFKKWAITNFLSTQIEPNDKHVAVSRILRSLFISVTKRGLLGTTRASELNGRSGASYI